MALFKGGLFWDKNGKGGWLSFWMGKNKAYIEFKIY